MFFRVDTSRTCYRVVTTRYIVLETQFLGLSNYFNSNPLFLKRKDVTHHVNLTETCVLMFFVRFFCVVAGLTIFAFTTYLHWMVYHWNIYLEYHKC